MQMAVTEITELQIADSVAKQPKMQLVLIPQDVLLLLVMTQA